MGLRILIATRLKLVLVLCALPHSVYCQANSIQDPASINAANKIFYLDSNSDCNGAIRELLGFEATIRGNDISSTRLGPSSCTIKLRSTGQFTGTVLDIEVKAMNIIDCGTQVSIYDGDEAQLSLMSFDCYSNLNQNKRRFFTTGDTATFIMTRQNVNSYNFDIEIKVNPVRGGTVPGYENNYGKGYFFDKFPQTTIVAMIGGFYALIAVICTIIIICLTLKYRKQDKEWETHQLSMMRPGSTFDTKSQPSYAWSVDMKQSRGPGSQYSQSSVDPHTRKTIPRSEDSVVFNNDSFQNQRLMNDKKDAPRPTRYASNNASFTEPEEEEDSDHFVERIITPRVKTRNKQPPSYDRAMSNHVSDHSSDEGTEVSSSDNSVKKRPLSSSEESRSSSTQSETVSQEGSESEDDRSSRGHGARAWRPKNKPHKSRRRDLDEDDGASSRSGHRYRQPPQPLQPQPQMHQVPYGAYPPGQFVPMMPYPGHLQPAAMAPTFLPQGYPEQQTPAPSGSKVEPTEPPVYSYLVRRGYTPLDVNSNPSGSIASGQRLGGRRLEDPEQRLDSGVEYMRR